MADLAPEGCYSLRDFYDHFTTWKWTSERVVEDLQLEERLAPLPEERRAVHRSAFSEVVDKSLAEAVWLFQSDKLRAFVVMPGTSERHSLSPRAWKDAYFPERMFLADAIGQGHGGEFDLASDRTPFVVVDQAKVYFQTAVSTREQSPASLALRDCLIGLAMDGVAKPSEVEEFRRVWNLAPMERRPSKERFDPKKLVAWTLPMALSWMVWRSYNRVCEALDDYRAEWWCWSRFRRKLPVNGGPNWYEANGAELLTLGPLTTFKMGLLEALTEQDEYDDVRMSVKSAREELWARLAEGALVATGIDAAGKVVQIPAHEWPYLILQSDRRQMDRLVFLGSGSSEAYRNVTALQSDVTSLWQRNPEPPHPPMMAMLLREPTWTLLEAATWVGCKGRDLPSTVVAEEDLEEKGAYAIFRALFPPKGLVATGINKKRRREPIPPEYWEMVTMDPAKYGQRHFVSFIDEILDGDGGQLTPVGEDKPGWFGITLDRDAVLRAFPEIEARPEEISIPVMTASSTTRETRTPDKLTATCDALRALYPKGLPMGLAAKDRLKVVNDWHALNGSSTVSATTIRRAIRLVSRRAK